MSYPSQTNTTAGLQYRGILDLALSVAPTTLSCSVFLFINGTMLLTLRSKAVFCEAARYILLYNLLFADTVQMVVTQILYLMSTCRIRLTYPVCGVLVMLSRLTTAISPLILVVMCLERYVAVCYPLRHAAIVTIRNTGVAVCVVWAFSSLNVLTRVLLLLDFPFELLESLQMKDVCSDLPMLLNPISVLYDKAFTCFLFVSAAAVVTSSYIGVIVAARSASTDKASARKARNTLLLHLVQLGLSLSSLTCSTLVTEISKTVDRVTLLQIQGSLYVFMVLFPKCLSPLIYGIRDQTIRPILMNRLCCRLPSQPRLRCHTRLR